VNTKHENELYRPFCNVIHIHVVVGDGGRGKSVHPTNLLSGRDHFKQETNFVSNLF